MTDNDRTMTVSWTDPAEALPDLATLDGIEYLTRVRDGLLPPPPIATVFGMTFGAIEVGRFEVRCTPTEAFFNPLGVVHGGLACTMLDTVLGCVAQTTLPAGTGYTSIDIQVQYLRPILPANGELTAVGRVVKGGRRVIFAAADLRDAAGALLATASSSLLVLAR
ncbi:PaaI family thioesterase [uncultured Amnibacterium sp.]|uniref:PaaI family thioesterase n=1 Tax=uncultured Amnibacterium sp. TaxID=1631851 RepID=UPI0035CAD286